MRKLSRPVAHPAQRGRIAPDCGCHAWIWDDDELVLEKGFEFCGALEVEVGDYCLALADEPSLSSLPRDSGFAYRLANLDGALALVISIVLDDGIYRLLDSYPDALLELK